MNTQSNIPVSSVKGDTIKARVTSNQYPSNLWELKVIFRGPSAGFTIEATPDGLAYSLLIPSSTTQAITAGDWVYQGVVTNDTEKYTAFDGSVIFKEDFGTGTEPYDARSQVKKTLDAVNAVIENRASKDQQQYTIAGRTLVRMPIIDLIKLQETYQRKFNKEVADDRRSKGLSTRSKILISFGGR